MGCHYSSLKDKLPKHHKPSGLIVILFMANKVAYTITGNMIYPICWNPAQMNKTMAKSQGSMIVIGLQRFAFRAHVLCTIVRPMHGSGGATRPHCCFSCSSRIFEKSCICAFVNNCKNWMGQFFQTDNFFHLDSASKAVQSQWIILN